MFGKKQQNVEAPVTPLLMSSTHDLPGRSFEVLGLVSENMAGLQLFELPKLFEKLEEHGRKLGADAVIGIQVVTVGQMGGFKYAGFGTAVKFSE